MSRNFNEGTFDALTQLKDAGAVTATGNATVASVAKILDLGTGMMECNIVLDVDAIDITTGDEAYHILVQVSSSSTFASDVWNVASIWLGDSSVTGESVDTVVGRISRRINNSPKGGTAYRYMRVRYLLAGTTPSIDFRAYLTKRQ